MKSQSIETNPQNTQMRELIGKNIKRVVIITTFHMFKKREETLKMLEVWKT